MIDGRRFASAARERRQMTVYNSSPIFCLLCASGRWNYLRSFPVQLGEIDEATHTAPRSRLSFFSFAVIGAEHRIVLPPISFSEVVTAGNFEMHCRGDFSREIHLCSGNFFSVIGMDILLY